MPRRRRNRRCHLRRGGELLLQVMVGDTTTHDDRRRLGITVPKEMGTAVVRALMGQFGYLDRDIATGFAAYA